MLVWEEAGIDNTRQHNITTDITRTNSSVFAFWKLFFSAAAPSLFLHTNILNDSFIVLAKTVVRSEKECDPGNIGKWRCGDRGGHFALLQYNMNHEDGQTVSEICTYLSIDGKSSLVSRCKMFDIVEVHTIDIWEAFHVGRVLLILTKRTNTITCFKMSFSPRNLY